MTMIAQLAQKIWARLGWALFEQLYVYNCTFSPSAAAPMRENRDAMHHKLLLAQLSPPILRISRNPFGQKKSPQNVVSH